MTTRPEAVLDEIWHSLQDATVRRTPFTLGYLGTIGLGGVPRVRAVILRGFDGDRKRVMFATNAASEKVTEIRRIPHVALTVNDDDRAVQLRIEGRARVLDDVDVRTRAWTQFGPHSRHLYASPLVPGTPLPDALQSGEPEDDEGAAFKRFAWVGIEPERLDWLDLSSPEHARWRFVREGDTWSGLAIVP